MNTEHTEPAHLVRMRNEHKEQAESLSRAKAFMKTDMFSALDAHKNHLLRKQAVFMEAYIKTLYERIEYESIGTVKESQGKQTIGVFGTDREEVLTIKTLASELIDVIKSNGKDPRESSIATTHIQTASMFGVSSLFEK